MSVARQQPEVPTWIAGLVTVLLGVTLGYSIVVMGSLAPALVAWVWLFGIGLSLFVVYLLYRFVVAVEEIADKL